MAAHRYWRITVQPQQWIGFAEIELRIDGFDQVGTGTATASSQFSGTYAADRAVDRNSTTWWSSTQNAGTTWWQYDFGSGNAKDIEDIAFMEIDAVRVPKSFTVSYSDDATTWTDWTPVVISSPAANQWYFVNATGLYTPSSTLSRYRISKSGMEVLYEAPDPDVRLSKSGIEIIYQKARPRVSEVGVEVLYSKARPRVSEVGIEILMSNKKKYDKLAARAAALGIERYIELVEIDGTEFGGHVFRLTPNYLSDTTIKFGGHDYQPAPIETDGFAFDMAGEFASPTITIGDPTGIIAAEARQYRHCKLFKVRRWITDYCYTDGQDPGTNDAFGPEEYYVSAMSDLVVGSHITFTLDNLFVIRKMTLPSRKMFRRHHNPDLAFPGIGRTTI
jgi:lambda family phage minor tail protein L